MARARVHEHFAAARAFVALLLSFALLASPLWATPSAAYGTVVFANRAQVGTAPASVGATVFSGDRLSTDEIGSLQVRAGAARLALSSGSIVTLGQQEASPAATLTRGTATFSTANSKAFALLVASAVIRPDTDKPAIGKVSVLGAKELTVQCVRGSLSIAVGDDVREIPEGMAYRVVLDPNAPPPQGPAGAGTSSQIGGPPVRPAKSRFMWYLIAASAAVTIWVVHEVYESAT